MAIRYAIASGNWSASGTWFGGVIPSHGDMAYANGFAVTIDQDINMGNEVLTNAGSFIPGQLYVITALGNTNFTLVGANSNTVGLPFLATGIGTGTGTATTRSGLTNSSLASPVIATNGTFTIGSNYNITASLNAGGSATLLNQITNASSTITGLVGFGRSSGASLNITTAGTFIINGDVYGPATSSSVAINIASTVAANVTVNGAIYGPASVSTSRAILIGGTSGTYIVNGNLTGGSSAATTSCISVTGNLNDITIIGNLTGGVGASTGADVISVSGAGNTFTITGTVLGGTGSGPGFSTAANPTIILNGDATARSGTAFSINGTGTTLTVNGNVTGSATSGGISAIVLNASGTVSVSGAVTGGAVTTAYGIAQNNATSSVTVANLVPNVSPALLLSSGTCVVNSNIAANAVTTIFGTSASNIALTVNGNVVGGTAAAQPAIDFPTTSVTGGTVTINGNVTGGSGLLSPAINGPTTTGIMTITVNGNATATATSNGVRSTATSVNNIVVLNGNVIDATNGVKGISSQRWYFGTTPSNRQIVVSVGGLSAYTFYGDATWALEQPAESDVRLNVLYGAGDIYTGTLNVPPTASVTLGVPVDNTTGTLTLTLEPADIRAAIGLATANLDTQFTAIPGAVRTNLATELGRIDVAVSSRLATAGYTAPTVPPTAAAIADEVRTELAVELGRIDIPISDATTDVSGIPGAVRTELATELGRIDAMVSSRLSSTTYLVTTPPPTAVSIASGVRSELSPELDRVANCATVDTTGAQLAALL